jgi:hypothetical protein
MEQLDGLGLVAGRYRLTEVLGRGGMGTVWRAEDELLGRTVAVKVIAAPDALIRPSSPTEPPSETGAQTAGRARREARAAGRLNHPGAVTVHDIIEEGHRLHIIMELIQAPTLSDLVRTEGPLHPARVAAIGEQLLDVLEFAHAEGIVHRDVKPSNVMVLPQDRVKLTDFGIARLRGDPQITTDGTTLGSPMFMAPEQAAGAPTGPAADLWSLGATMYFAVEGRGPFDREVPMATIAAIISQPPDPTRLAGPLMPALAALLVRSPQNRPDGIALRRLLRLDGHTVNTDDPGSLPNASAPRRSRPANPNHPQQAGQVSNLMAAGQGAPLASSQVGQGDWGGQGGQGGRGGQGNGMAMKGLVGVLLAAVVALTFVLVQRDSDANDKPGSNGAAAQQNPGAATAATPTDPAATEPAATDPAAADPAAADSAAGDESDLDAATALSPLAPDAPSDQLGLGSAGRANLRQLEKSEVGPRGQNLARNFKSVSNPVGGYALGMPLAFESTAVGPTTLIDWNDTMFRSAFEVRSYRAVLPFARLIRDEKQFAKDHREDGYQRKKLTRRWTYRGQQAAAWEFTWNYNGAVMHAREVAFRVGPRTYTVLYRSADLWWLSGGSADFPNGFESSFFPTP